MLLLFEKELIICQKIKNKHFYVDSFPVDEKLLIMNGCSLNQNEFQLSCIHSVLKKQYHFNFGLQIHMEIWKKQFEEAILNQTFPNENHKFDLTNFGNIPVQCHVCNKLLKGIFFQGYKCSFCFQIAHKHCLKNFSKCRKPEIRVPDSIPDRSSEPSINSKKQERLRDYPWYIECDRRLCIQIFCQIPAEKEHLFMIRYDTIKYTISIKSKNSQEVKHLMILEESDFGQLKLDQSNNFYTSNTSNDFQRKDSVQSIQIRYSSVVESAVFFTMDKLKYFSSIVDLVDYYTSNSLSEIFEVNLNK